jgi:FlaA1/EpsC-like NDP-sugar epimerase
MQVMNHRVLVTGATGYIGRRLLRPRGFASPHRMLKNLDVAE